MYDIIETKKIAVSPNPITTDTSTIDDLIL